MPQTAVADRMTIGIVGQLADLHSMADARVKTATNQEASAQIPFGIMVIRGSLDDSALLLHTSAAAMVTGQLLQGVSTHGHAFAEPQELADTDAGGLQPDATFGVLEIGTIIVAPENAVTPASEVHVRAVAGVGEQAGAFRATADGSDTVDITAFAKWLTSAGAGQPAVLEIDMTNSALAVADV